MSATPKITDKVTKKVAGLIKLELAASEIASYTSQLSKVLESVEVLAELDTSKVEATSQTHGLQNIWRNDEPTPGLDMKKYKNTKNFKDGYFIVDKVL